MRSDWLDRCLHMKNELPATSPNTLPWGRVSSCLQCNTCTQSSVCCGHSPGESPPLPSFLPSYLRCARTGGTAALRCRVAAFVSHFPRVQSCCVALFTRPTACSAVESSCVFSVGVGEGVPSALGFTGPTVTKRKRATSDAQEPPRNDAASSPHLWKPRAGRGGVCAPCFYISNQL